MTTPLSRRTFLAASSAAALAAASSSMKLSITVRIAEAPGSNQKTTMGFEEIVGIAKTVGYEAVEMRASQGGIQTPKDRLKEMRKVADAAGIKICMVTGDFDLPSNNANAPQCLRRIGPYCDVAEILGCDLLRVALKTDEDIPFAQRACDEARERKIRLCHESHTGTLFETVAGSLHALKAVKRSNFGIAYEAANWMVAGQDYGPETIKKIKPWLMSVFIQNFRISPEGKNTMNTWSRGPVKVDLIGSWEKGGVDYPKVFETLHAIGYTGYVTAFGAFATFATPEEAAAQSFKYLKPLAT